jgi:hypothetical protein
MDISDEEHINNLIMLPPYIYDILTQHMTTRQDLREAVRQYVEHIYRQQVLLEYDEILAIQEG